MRAERVKTLVLASGRIWPERVDSYFVADPRIKVSTLVGIGFALLLEKERYRNQIKIKKTIEEFDN